MPIRPARPDDAPRLTALAHAAKRHWGYPEAWIEAWRAALTVTPSDLAVLDVRCAEDGGGLAGFYALGGAPPVCILEHLWVGPEAMGRGVGRALFLDAAARATARGATLLEIDSDPHAEGFYLRMGARRVGTTVDAVLGQRRERPLLRLALDPTAPPSG